MIFFTSLRRRQRKSPSLVKPTQLHHTVLRIAGFLVAMCALHVAAMVLFESMAPFDAVWLTATTLFTVGYGDLSAKTIPGRLSTMLLLYGAGIFILAMWVSKFTEWREYVRDRKRSGQWRWNVQDHVVVIGTPELDAAFFLHRLAQQMRISRELAHRSFLMLTHAFPEGTPDKLLQLDTVHYTGTGVHPGDLSAAHVERAWGVMVLADRVGDITSDSKTLDVVTQLRDMGFRGTIAAECVGDANRQRLHRAGADAVIRPMRGYPEMLVRALVSPGCEDILENLFTSEGDELVRVQLVDRIVMSWRDIACRVIAQDIGIPVGYMDNQGNVITNPRAAVEVATNTLYVVLHERVQNPNELIQRALVG